MNTKLIIVALLAFTVGGSCPSDIDNNGEVGITDFLQVLADWGPCPAARLVSMEIDASHIAVAWSDGRVVGGWINGTESVLWDEAPPSSHVGIPVDMGIDAAGPGATCVDGPCFDQGFDEQAGHRLIYRAYADGYVERIQAAFCVNRAVDEICIDWGQGQPEWEPIPGQP